jgi:hypothetical protein
MYKEYQKDIGTTVYIYTLTHDIKVLSLVNPSKYSRMTRKKKTFIKECSAVPKGCMPKIGNSYDPCLSATMVKKYPDVVGMLTLSPGDNKLLKKALKHGISKKTQKTFHKAQDSFGIDEVPELILHPLTKRPSKDIKVHEQDKLENNYQLLKKMKYSEDDLHEFMKNAKYNPDTYFFDYKLSKSTSSSSLTSS